jgi:hypothetical protein
LQHIATHQLAPSLLLKITLLKILLKTLIFASKLAGRYGALGCGKISTLFAPSQNLFNELNGNSCQGK